MSTEILIWIGVGIIALVINAFIIRLALDIGKLIKQHNEITELLKRK